MKFVQKFFEESSFASCLSGQAKPDLNADDNAKKS
jgi:hypothetical protein